MLIITKTKVLAVPEMWMGTDVKVYLASGTAVW
jgi:hypothetical protein